MPVGIVRDGAGWRAYVRVAQGKGGLVAKRFPLETTLDTMKAWRESTRAAARTGRRPHAAARGTLNADIDRYLELVSTMPSLSDRARDLHAWGNVLGMRPRLQLTAHDYRVVLNDWRLYGKAGSPLAASTVNHRRTALEHVYTVLDGKDAPNPLRAVPKFREPPPEPRGLPMATIEKILKKLPKGTKTRARILVLAWTGIRGSSELGKMRPEHVNVKLRTCWVPTGKHGTPRQLVLNEAGVKAWKEFIKVDAWGPYSKGSLRKAFRAACQAAKVEPPPRPYDLRHSIATALLKAGADLADVQAHLGHSSPAMARRYAPYQSQKLRSAIDGI